MRQRPTTASAHVDIVLARGRAYVRWPYDHKFMQLFNEFIPFQARHFYSESKWWHIEQRWWGPAFDLFRAHYADGNIHITGDFENEEAPTYDEDYPEYESSEAGGDDEIDLNTGQVIVSLEKLTFPKAYAILHLLPTATPEDAKAMYRHLSNIYHPDNGGTDRDQSRINRAYSFISDGGSYE